MLVKRVIDRYLVVDTCSEQSRLRLISDVHWLSDIIGGAFFSAGLDLLYFAATRDEFAIRNNEKEVLK